MSSVSICPTVTAVTVTEFQRQVLAASELSLRIHIDAADGDLAPRQLLPLDEIWWPAGISADLHVMYRRPMEHIAVIVGLQPRLVIVHAEASGDFRQFSAILHEHNIEAGVALLPETDPAILNGAFDYIDHVLIFAGNLGYQGGGAARLDQLAKVAQLKSFKPQLEIGWDGGAKLDNIARLAGGGVEVVNVGSYLQVDQPAEAYAKLQQALAA